VELRVCCSLFQESQVDVSDLRHQLLLYARLISIAWKIFIANVLLQKGNSYILSSDFFWRSVSISNNILSFLYISSVKIIRIYDI
jgi:hypothetical protein